MEENIDSLKNLLEKVGNEYAYKKICELNNEEINEYNRLLKIFKLTNSNTTVSNNEKGIALEELAAYTIRMTHVFDIYKNIRTSTNELDQLVRICDNQRMLIGLKVIDDRLMNFIGECKNYQGRVPVTYVGKVCSLLSTTQNKICILFSYNGVTGENWNESSGLIKKFYLSKENMKERFCILDFNIRDFERIASGDNFLQIIEDKIMALKIDTDYSNLLTNHEASVEILEAQRGGFFEI